MLEWNAPLPAGFAGRRAGVRNGVAVASTGHGGRAIGGQPMAPVLVAGLQRFLDEQAAESGAIDEEIAGNAPAILQVQRLDESALGVLIHSDDLPFDAHRAALFSVAT